MANPEQEARKALKKWMAMLADPAQRQAFTHDPLSYMQSGQPTGGQIDVDDLPPKLRQFLQSLQGDDTGVALLATMQSDLDASQLLDRKNPNDPANFSTVSKF